MFGMNAKTSALVLAAAGIVTTEAYQTTRGSRRVEKKRPSRKLSTSCKYKNGSAASYDQNPSTTSSTYKSGDLWVRRLEDVELDVECDPDVAPPVDELPPTVSPVVPILGDCDIATVYKTLYLGMDDDTLFEHALQGLYTADCATRCQIIDYDQIVCPFNVFAARPTDDDKIGGWPRKVGNLGSDGCAWTDSLDSKPCPYTDETSYDLNGLSLCTGDARASAILQIRDAIMNDACGFCASDDDAPDTGIQQGLNGFIGIAP